jgi:hypothetical protein
MRSVKHLHVMLLAVIFGVPEAWAQPFRPPAVPLVTFDPYLSVWSCADRLTDDTTRHWTRREHPLVSLIRVDGQVFRLMGTDPKDAPALPQVGLQVTPTRSIYDFEDAKVHVTLTFMTPALPYDLDALSLPLSFLTWQVRSVDGKGHTLSIYDGTSSQLAVNQPDEKVEWARQEAGTLTALRVGTREQPVLGSWGDDHRINWGYVYAAAPTAQAKAAIGPDQAMVGAFAAGRELPTQDDTRMPRPANEDQPVMAFVFDVGTVTAQEVTRQVIVGYDEIYTLKYFGRRLRPYWRRHGETPEQMLQQASRDYPQLAQRCAEFDAQLLADARRLGGERYAQICALAYRQCIAACGLAADAKSQPLLFPKENTSNGCVSTVDVLFPMAPMFILLSPTLAKGSLVPIFVSTVSGRYPAAPHDLGTYPVVRLAPEGEGPMPVEETANMLILCDAIAHAEGHADFVAPWWPRLTEWAQYLEQYGLDPANQLCTDDFMGHLAHNANLSVKAILGLAAYGDLCRLRGDQATAERYGKLAKADAEHWMQVAAEGDHYRLAFDQPNTWSQKYNLVWDRILGLNLFPPEVARKEVAYYKTQIQRYGLPLDSRTKLTKTDWSLWSATLAENPADFEAMISPIVDYLNATTSRSPFVDSYVTDNVRSDGMRSRPVIGGVFIKMLADPAVWKKWARRDTTKAGPWAPLPAQPQVTEVVPTSQKTPCTWRYTFQKPAGDWTQPGSDASGWKEGPASFGTAGTPGAVVRTRWDTDDIWVLREFTMPSGEYPNLQFYVHHDEDVEIYLNGVLAATEGSFTTNYGPLEIRPPARALLKPGAKILMAVHCHQTGGGQNIDVGLAQIVEPRP